jgi:hypothetical protein
MASPDPGRIQNRRRSARSLQGRGAPKARSANSLAAWTRNYRHDRLRPGRLGGSADQKYCKARPPSSGGGYSGLADARSNRGRNTRTQNERSQALGENRARRHYCHDAGLYDGDRDFNQPLLLTRRSSGPRTHPGVHGPNQRPEWGQGGAGLRTSGKSDRSGVSRRRGFAEAMHADSLLEFPRHARG